MGFISNTVRAVLRVGAALLLSGFLVSPSGAGQALSQPSADDPKFEPGPCPFKASEDVSYRITCGTVAVAENRSRADGRRVKLAVAVVHAHSDHPEPDPVVYIDGGPGQSAMELVPLRLRVSTRVQAILKTRDYIFWEQRGVGPSEPHLCTLLDTEWFRNILLGYSVDEQRRHNLEAFATCRAELERSHTDISQFGTATSAADLEGVRRALGIKSWNLDGGSYGTRLGLVAMRDAPGAIRSVMLDGVLPIDALRYNANAWRFARVMELLDSACTKDQTCHTRFPDLIDRTYRLIAALKAQPRIVHVTPGPEFPVDHMVITDRVLASGLFGAFYDNKLIPLLPAIIEQIEHGNDATFEAMAGSILSTLGSIRQSLNVAVDCHDAMPLTKVISIHAANAAFPPLADAFEDDESFNSYCENWNTNAASAEELAPTTSAIPTLILVGDFDPVTPPEYAEQARRSLSASTVLEFPNGTHAGKSYLPCVAGVEVAFLSHPDKPLDLRCARDFTQISFATEVFVLPGLTRLFLGLQTNSHRALIAIVGLAGLLPILCLIGAVISAVRLRRRTLKNPASPRTFVAFASIAILGVLAVLVVDVMAAVDSNPNFLLLGLPGTPHVLIYSSLLVGLLTMVLLGTCLRRLMASRRLVLSWLGAASALAYLGAFAAIVQH